MSLLKAENLSLFYSSNSKTPALKNVSVSVEEGRITQLLGKSGSGKTSLLKCFANLQTKFSGILSYRGIAIKSMKPQQRASHIGFVSQSFDLFPHMTVIENCTHPQIHVLKRTKDEALSNALNKLQNLGMAEYINRLPNELSGGQKQRVSIARALCMNSHLLLLDEPTSSLDPQSSKKLVEILKKLNQEDGITIALSTHDMTFSKHLMDVVYFMEQGQVVEYLDIKKAALESTMAIKGFFDH